MSGDYEKDCIYLRVYYMLLNGKTSLEEITFNEDRMLRNCTKMLPNPLMCLVISNTYLHPRSSEDIMKLSYEKQRSQAELEECFGISRELYGQMLKFAERFLRYNMVKSELYDYKEYREKRRKSKDRS